jgi:hypothetical protein
MSPLADIAAILTGVGNSLLEDMPGLALEATMKRIIESQDKVRTTGAEEGPEGARNGTLHFRLAIRAGDGFSF